MIVVSPDSTQDERSGEYYYTIRVATSGNLTDGNDEPVQVAPGMVANVQLLGEKQSVLEYILTPITRLQRSALRE